MGREREPGLHSIAGRRVNWQRPLEDPADGCPGSWSRCRFVLSLLPFLRRRAEGGDRVPNRLLDEADDLIWQWVQLVEEYQERWHAHLVEESMPRD